MSLSENLVKWMARRGLSQSQLAEKSGITRARISQLIHRNNHSPNLYTIQRIAKALDCSIDELVSGDTKHERLHIDMSGAMDILRHYGAPNQLLKLAEECRELEQAAIVAHRDLFFDGAVEDSHNYNLIEEMADVCVVLYQIMQWLYAQQTVRDIAWCKIARQKMRMEEENADHD